MNSDDDMLTNIRLLKQLFLPDSLPYFVNTTMIQSLPIINCVAKVFVRIFCYLFVAQTITICLMKATLGVTCLRTI